MYFISGGTPRELHDFVEIIFLHRSLYGHCNRKCSTVSTAVTHLEDSRWVYLWTVVFVDPGGHPIFCFGLVR